RMETVQTTLILPDNAANWLGGSVLEVKFDNLSVIIPKQVLEQLEQLKGSAEDGHIVLNVQPADQTILSNVPTMIRNSELKSVGETYEFNLVWVSANGSETRL